MRTGLKLLGVHSENAAIIGDRMDTDIIAGIESGLDTVLVLSGVTERNDCLKFPYRPRVILDGVGDIRPRQKISRKKRQIIYNKSRPIADLKFHKNTSLVIKIRVCLS